MPNSRIKNSSKAFASDLTILILLWLSICQVGAQEPEFAWAKRGEGRVFDLVSITALDDFGNTIVVGLFEKTTTFGKTSLTSDGGRNIFIAKYDAMGNVLWAKKVDVSEDDYVHGVATDGFGNSILTGYFTGTAIFGPISLTSTDKEDIFVVKYDSSGNVIWAKQAGGEGDDRAYSITTDREGNIIVTGCFENTVTFDTKTVYAADNADVYFDMACVGKIHVRTEPWCSVSLNGQVEYTSPFVIKDVSFGTNRLVLRREGYKTVVYDISITDYNRYVKFSERLLKE